MTKIKNQTTYYVSATSDIDLWKRRRHKRQSSPTWERIPTEIAEECIETKKYTVEIYPDNDDYHCIHTFDVKVKKETLITEICE